MTSIWASDIEIIELPIPENSQSIKKTDYKANENRLSTYNKEYYKEYYKANRAKIAATSKEYYKTNRAKNSRIPQKTT